MLTDSPTSTLRLVVSESETTYYLYSVIDIFAHVSRLSPNPLLSGSRSLGMAPTPGRMGTNGVLLIGTIIFIGAPT